MTLAFDIWTTVFAVLGCGFVTAGTIGILRFPDLRCRLHAMTKADTVGLGLIVVALLPRVGSVPAALKLLLIWVLALTAGAVSASLLPRGAAPTRLGDHGLDTAHHDG